MDEKLLESFSLKKLVGKGGFAEVYLAVERATQTPVAVKCLAKARILRPVKRKNGVPKTPQEEKVSSLPCICVYSLLFPVYFC